MNLIAGWTLPSCLIPYLHRFISQLVYPCAASPSRYSRFSFPFLFFFFSFSFPTFPPPPPKRGKEHSRGRDRCRGYFSSCNLCTAVVLLLVFSLLSCIAFESNRTGPNRNPKQTFYIIVVFQSFWGFSNPTPTRRENERGEEKR